MYVKFSTLVSEFGIKKTVNKTVSMSPITLSVHFSTVNDCPLIVHAVYMIESTKLHIYKNV